MQYSNKKNGECSGTLPIFYVNEMETNMLTLWEKPQILLKNE